MILHYSIATNYTHSLLRYAVYSVGYSDSAGQSPTLCALKFIYLLTYLLTYLYVVVYLSLSVLINRVRCLV